MSPDAHTPGQEPDTPPPRRSRRELDALVSACLQRSPRPSLRAIGRELGASVQRVSRAVRRVEGASGGPSRTPPDTPGQGGGQARQPGRVSGRVSAGGESPGPGRPGTPSEPPGPEPQGTPPGPSPPPSPEAEATVANSAASAAGPPVSPLHPPAGATTPTHGVATGSPTVSFAADDLAAIQRAVAAVAATPGATAEAVARAVRDQLAKLPGAQDKELELAAQAIEQETKRHVTAIAQEAEVTQGTALAIGRSLLEVWHRMGAPSGFRDAQEWVRTLVDFWWHNRDSVSALHDEVDRLEGLVAAQSAALDPVRRQEAVMSRILALADMAHSSGTPYSEEELQALIRTVYTILDGHGAPSITVLGNGGR